MPTANRIIYFDHAATTPVAPEVVEAMLPYFSGSYGNPSSIHRLGRESARALDIRVCLTIIENCFEKLFTRERRQRDQAR